MQWIKNTATLSAAVALAWSGASVWAQDAEVDVEVPAVEQRQSTEAPKLPPGIQAREMDDDHAEDIHEVLAEIVEAALTDDGFDDLVERLVDEDRNRIGDTSDEQMAELNRAAARLSAAWEQRYDDEFDIDDDDNAAKVFGTFIAYGEVTDPAQVLNHWPVAATSGSERTGEARPAAGGDAGEQVEDTATKANLDEGRNVAVIRLPEFVGMPALTVSLVREAAPFGWKVDVPNHLTNEQLRANLLTHLNKLNERADWPESETEAHGIVARHVLMALYGLDDQGRAARDLQQGAAEDVADQAREAADRIEQQADDVADQADDAADRLQDAGDQIQEDAQDAAP